MTDYILSKLQETSNNGPSSGIRPATLKQMVRELSTKDRLVKVEVKKFRYSLPELAQELSLPIEELQRLTRPIHSCDLKRKTDGNLGMKILNLYCKTKFYVYDQKEILG